MNSATDWSVAQEVFETATGQTCDYTISADSFADQFPIDPNNVNYIIGIFGGAIVLVAMFMMGFKLAEKPADQHHPFGHARIEYLSGLIVAFNLIGIL